MQAPEAYVKWINQHLGFNPRSQAHSDALSDFVVRDLRRFCPALRKALDRKELRSITNADVATRVAGRNVDLVLSETAGGPRLAVRLAVEHKTIMTAHGKARWNRYGDIIAYCNHMHNHARDCIAGSIVVVNSSATYQNPDAFARDLTRARVNMGKVAEDTVRIFAEIPQRNEADEPNDQPEALAVVVVQYDGRNRASLVSEPPAPQVGGVVHYEAFMERICRLYQKRFR